MQAVTQADPAETNPPLSAPPLRSTVKRSPQSRPVAWSNEQASHSARRRQAPLPSPPRRCGSATADSAVALGSPGADRLQRRDPTVRVAKRRCCRRHPFAAERGGEGYQRFLNDSGARNGRDQRRGDDERLVPVAGGQTVGMDGPGAFRSGWGRGGWAASCPGLHCSTPWQSPKWP